MASRGPVDSLRFYEDLTLDHGDVCLLFFFCGEIGRWKVNGVQLCQIQNHPEKHPNFKITKQFSSLVFSIIECIFTLSRFLKEKNLSRIHHSSVISNLKFWKNIKHS